MAAPVAGTGDGVVWCYLGGMWRERAGEGRG